MKKLLLVFMSAFFLSGCNRLDQHQPLTSVSLRFMEGETITQQIEASRNNLNTVSICVRNEGRALLPMTFALKEGEDTVRTLDFSSGNIDNEDCTKFKFEPVTDSAGKTYIVTISSPKPDKNKLTPTVLLIEKHEGVFHYKTQYYQPFVGVVRESLTQLWVRLGGDPLFISTWAVAVAYLSIRLIKSRS